jgi:hypothetical protein
MYTCRCHVKAGRLLVHGRPFGPSRRALHKSELALSLCDNPPTSSSTSSLFTTHCARILSPTILTLALVTRPADILLKHAATLPTVSTWLSQTFPPSSQPWVSNCAHCLPSSSLLRVHATDLPVQLSKTRLLLQPLRHRNRRRRANHHPPPTQARFQRKPRAHLRPAHTFHNPLAVAVSTFVATSLRPAAQ